MLRRYCLPLFWIVAAGVAVGGLPPKPDVLPVRVTGPQGTRVTLLAGPGATQTAVVPCDFSLRPGFRYRLKIEGLAAEPLFPTLEIFDTLAVPPQRNPADYPSPLPLSLADGRDAAAGILVTKWLTVEDASSPLAGVTGHGADVDIAPAEDAFHYARELGRPIALFRLGLRSLSIDEEVQTVPEPLPPACVQLAAPKGGEEFVKDGGDEQRRVHFDLGRRLQGLDPTDTVAEFTTSRDERRLTVSNRVCVFSPRIVAVRHTLPPAGIEQARGAAGIFGRDLGVRLEARNKDRVARQLDEAPSLRVRSRLNADIHVAQVGRLTEFRALSAVELPLGLFAFLGTDQAPRLEQRFVAKMARQIDLAITLSDPRRPQEYRSIEGVRGVGIVDGLGSVTAELETRTAVYFCEPPGDLLPEQPLQLLKWASTDAAVPGEVITFHIRFSNLGGKPIRDVAISDNLSPRLEYVPGSARADREAVFVLEDNDSGTQTLRWEIRHPLAANAKGTVRFQARVK